MSFPCFTLKEAGPRFSALGSPRTVALGNVSLHESLLHSLSDYYFVMGTLGSRIQGRAASARGAGSTAPSRSGASAVTASPRTPEADGESQTSTPNATRSLTLCTQLLLYARSPYVPR